jgi:hypothetical protein
MSAGLNGLFDFVGYACGQGGSARHAAFQLSLRQLFHLHSESEQRRREAEVMLRKIENVLESGWKGEEWAVSKSRQEQWRQGWAATYTTLLAEV